MTSLQPEFARLGLGSVARYAADMSSVVVAEFSRHSVSSLTVACSADISFSVIEEATHSMGSLQGNAFVTCETVVDCFAGCSPDVFVVDNPRDSVFITSFCSEQPRDGEKESVVSKRDAILNGESLSSWYAFDGFFGCLLQKSSSSRSNWLSKTSQMSSWRVTTES